MKTVENTFMVHTGIRRLIYPYINFLYSFRGSHNQAISRCQRYHPLNSNRNADLDSRMYLQCLSCARDSLGYEWSPSAGYEWVEIGYWDTVWTWLWWTREWMWTRSWYWLPAPKSWAILFGASARLEWTTRRARTYNSYSNVRIFLASHDIEYNKVN